MTAGSTIVFSNGDRRRQHMRKPSSPCFAVFTEPWQKKWLQLAILKKSCWEFSFSSRVGAQQPSLCSPRVNYGSNGYSRKKGRIKINFLEGNSAKESTHNISLLSIDYGTVALWHTASSIRLTNSDFGQYKTRTTDYGLRTTDWV